MRRGNTTARGYGYRHQQVRKQWAPAVSSGTVKCARCGGLIAPGSPWHLDHRDPPEGGRDRGHGYAGPSHAECNVNAGAHKGAERRWQQPETDETVWNGEPVTVYDGPSAPVGVRGLVRQRGSSSAPWRRVSNWEGM